MVLSIPRTLRALAAMVVIPFVGLTAVSAQEAPRIVNQPPEFAAVRALYEGKTAADILKMGYVPEPECVSSPLGGMGFHAIHPQWFAQQFTSGVLDPAKPPIVLLDSNLNVVGLEWEASRFTEEAPVIFGQTVEMYPGHAGLEAPHYMFHAYFRPNGQVLYSLFDPELSCPSAGTLPASRLSLSAVLNGITGR